MKKSHRLSPVDLIPVIAVFYAAVYFSLDVRNWIDLRSVTVSGNGIDIAVDRSVLQDFRGYYIVTINRASGEQICTTGKVDHNYQVFAKPRKDPDLKWWAFGGSCNVDLPAPLLSGDYIMNTCHTVARPHGIFPSIQRCVKTAFTVS